MTPHYQDDWLQVWHGDCREAMAAMKPESVHCVATSPPYWGLRDYGAAGQLGLEATPEAYVAAMVAVFREVRRVLRADGTVWLNLGDSYAANGVSGLAVKGESSTLVGTANAAHTAQRKIVPSGLKPKDLVGIPWRTAFALQADGWFPRSDVIWAKPNPMPESVTDRPTKAHEYIFLLSKSARYYFDADAVREDALQPVGAPKWTGRQAKNEEIRGDRGYLGSNQGLPGRNIRSVWTIATAPYPGAHFATFPPKLVERCIKAGTSERGVCATCGAPWERIAVEVANGSLRSHGTNPGSKHLQSPKSRLNSGTAEQYHANAPRRETTGWQPSCTHVSPLPPRPATILDPFAGSGTTGLVAQSLSRRAVLIDLSLDYLGQLMDRNRDIPLGLEVPA